MTEEEQVQQIIDDLDSAILYLPEYGTMRESLRLASELLVECECDAMQQISFREYLDNVGQE